MKLHLKTPLRAWREGGAWFDLRLMTQSWEKYSQIHTNSRWRSGARQWYADYLNFSSEQFEQFVHFQRGVPKELKINSLFTSISLALLSCSHVLTFLLRHTRYISPLRVRAYMSTVCLFNLFPLSLCLSVCLSLPLSLCLPLSLSLSLFLLF